MEKNRVFQRIEEEVRLFFEEAGKASEPIYLGLLTLYVAVFYILKIAWAPGIDKAIEMLK